MPQTHRGLSLSAWSGELAAMTSLIIFAYIKMNATKREVTSLLCILQTAMFNMRTPTHLSTGARIYRK